MPETPRAYAVDRKAMGPWIFKAAYETPFAGEHLVKVYEAAPVDVERERLLDLLEERHGAPDWDENVSSRVEAALREYGRGKEES